MSAVFVSRHMTAKAFCIDFRCFCSNSFIRSFVFVFDPYQNIELNCPTAINLAILLSQGGVRPKNVAIICCWRNGRYLQIGFCIFF